MKKSIFSSEYNDTTTTVIDGDQLLLDDELIIVLKDNDKLKFNIKNIKKKPNKKSKIIFRSEIKLIGKLSDVDSGSIHVNLPNYSPKIGGFIIIEGVIVHENYIPSRLTSAKVCCQIEDTDNNKVKLDRTIPFSLVNVVAYEIPDCELDISGHLDSVSVDIKNVAKLNFDLKFSGEIKDRGVLLNIDTSSKLKGEVNFESCNCMIGMALNNIGSGHCDITQINTGSHFSDSKVVRANALLNFSMSYWGKHAVFRDLGIHGARNVTLNVNSSHGGSELFERDDNSANRLESVVLAESQDIKIYANINDANDQGLELISCNNIEVYGSISNSKRTESTEGALVIKGESKNITIEASVYAYQSRAIKLECSRGAKNIILTERNFAFANDNEAISVRDSIEPYNSNIEIYGKYKAVIPIAIRKYSDGCIINATIDMSIAEVGVVVQSPVRKVNIKAINTNKNKQLLSVGGLCTQYNLGSISGDSPGCYLQLNNDSRYTFNFNTSRQLNCDVKMAGDSAVITFVNGIPYSELAPKFGQYEIGDMFIKTYGPVRDVILSKSPVYKVYTGSGWI